jgi:hypothetical protein
MLKLNRMNLLIALLAINCGFTICNGTTTSVSEWRLINIPKDLFDKIDEPTKYLLTQEIKKYTFDYYVQYTCPGLDLHISQGKDVSTGKLIYSATSGRNASHEDPRILFATISRIFNLKSKYEAAHGLLELSESKLTVDLTELETFLQAMKHLDEDLK